MKKLFCILLTLAMVLAMFAGCGSHAASAASEQTLEAEKSAGEAPTEEASAENVAPAGVPSEVEASLVEENPEVDAEAEPTKPAVVIEYPISDGTQTISAFAAVPMFVLNVLEDADITNANALQALAAATGVNMEFHGYQAMNAAEEYGIMFASQDYPDLLANAVDYYSGGAEKLIEDEVIVDLNDYLTEYAPDYLAALDATPSIKQSITTDSGYIGVFAGWKDPSAINTGLIIRQDWLEELSLETPATYDELGKVLEAFKAEYNCKDPLYLVSYCGGTFADNGLIKGYGVAGMIGDRANQHPFYAVDGVVQCGLLTDEYKSYLTMMADWYAKGLISSDFISYSSPSMDDNAIVSDSCGVFYSSNDKFQTSYSLTTNEKFKLSALHEPTVNEGETIHLSQDLYAPTTIQNAWSISMQCTEPELAASYLNYLYTEAGTLLTNYGTEGVSFEYVDGQPALTDMIMNDPDNSAFTMQYLYTTGNFLPGLVDQHKSDSAMEETALASYDIWAENVDCEYTIINDLLPSEADAYQALWGDISAYAQQTALSFITGSTAISEFDSFVDTLKDMGIEQLTKYRQNAVDSFIAK